MSAIVKQLALIGLGHQSRSELVPAILKLKNKCKIIAICDINKNFVKETLKLFPDPKKISVYGNYTDLFRDVNENKGLVLDGVVVSVPHFLYSDIVEQAVLKSVAVFKEKPFALNLEEAQKLSRLALKKGVQIYTVIKRQFYPSYATGLRLLNDGEIGKPYMYSARHFTPNGNLYDGWRSTVQAAGGGVLIDMGYHLLDVILRYFGDVSQVNFHWSNVAKPNHTYEVEDAASLHNWHPSGVHGVFQLAALSGAKEEEIEVRGTKGKIVVTDSNLKIYDVQGSLKNTFSFKTNGIDATTEALKQFLLNDKSIWSQNISHNMKLMRVIDMAYKRRFS